jgi:hypothetical protein
MDILTLEQLIAFNSFLEFLNNSDKIFLLSGCAGVGKTFLSIKFIQTSINLYDPNEIVVLCPTHKALTVIENKYNESYVSFSPPIKFQTIAKFFLKTAKYNEDGTRYFQNKTHQKVKEKLIFIDESSMITDDDFNQFVELTKNDEHDIKLVFIGDYAQLEPIQNSGMSKIFNDKYLEENNIHIIKSELKEIIRSKNNELSELYDAFRTFVDNQSHEIQFKKEWYDEMLYNHILFVDKKIDFYKLIAKHFTIEKDCKIISYRNEMVKEYNNFVRNILFNKPIDSYVVGEHLIFNEPYNDIFNNNDEIEISQIEKTSKRHPNGNVYKVYVMKTTCGEEIIALQEESKEEYLKYFNTLKKQILSKKNKSWKKYYQDFYLFNPPFSYSYAITTHKAQGSTIDVCFVDLYDIFYTLLHVQPKSIEKTLYTAISRASTNLYCYF